MEKAVGPEYGSANDPTNARNNNSISFVVTTIDEPAHAVAVLENMRSAIRENDEVIVLSGSDPNLAAAVFPPWIRVVAIPGASVFSLRAHVPAVSRKEWVVVLEDHAPMDARAVDAIRELISTKPEIDLIAILGKNLTSVSRWGWAVFIYTFALVWAPVGTPPPFSIVTSAIVRRAKLGRELPLAEGVWELQLIPQIFASGKIAYSNDIYIDHIKPLNAASAILIGFHNARAGAALQRTLGIPTHKIIYEGWYAFMPRPKLLAEILGDRVRELPPGTFRRVRAIGFAHLIGNIVGSYFGSGRAAYKV